MSFAGLGLIDEALDVSFPPGRAGPRGRQRAGSGWLSGGRPAGGHGDRLGAGGGGVHRRYGRPAGPWSGVVCSRVSVGGRRPRATRRSPSRPSATCRGMGRSTASLASGTSHRRSGRRACGRSGSRRPNTASLLRPGYSCAASWVGWGLPPRPEAGRRGPTRRRGRRRRDSPSVRARGRPGSRPGPGTSACARPSTGWRAGPDRRRGAAPLS